MLPSCSARGTHAFSAWKQPSGGSSRSRGPTSGSVRSGFPHVPGRIVGAGARGAVRRRRRDGVVMTNPLLVVYPPDKRGWRRVRGTGRSTGEDGHPSVGTGRLPADRAAVAPRFRARARAERGCAEAGGGRGRATGRRATPGCVRCGADRARDAGGPGRSLGAGGFSGRPDAASTISGVSVSLGLAPSSFRTVRCCLRAAPVHTVNRRCAVAGETPNDSGNTAKRTRSSARAPRP